MASTARIHRITTTIGAAVTHSTARIHAITAQVTQAHSTARIHSISATVAAGHSTARIHAITTTSTIPGDLQARPGPARTAESYVPVVLDGTGSTGPWTQAGWSFVSDTRVPELGLPVPAPIVVDGLDTDSIVAVDLPAHPRNYQATFQLAVSDGITIATAQVTLSVYAWLFWYLDASGVIRPEVMYRQ